MIVPHEHNPREMVSITLIHVNITLSLDLRSLTVISLIENLNLGYEKDNVLNEISVKSKETER